MGTRTDSAICFVGVLIFGGNFSLVLLGEAWGAIETASDFASEFYGAHKNHPILCSNFMFFFVG